MGIDDSKLGDAPPPPAPAGSPAPFLQGQLADSQSLGDPGTGSGNTFQPNWLPEFKKQLHGIFVFTGDNHDRADQKKAQVLKIFGIPGPKPSITIVTSITGDVRPGKEAGHEHFGFLDGISNPAVTGFDNKPLPGPPPVRPGVILVGRDGDPVAKRDPWMVDGSCLAFRFLFQLVPEFHKFLNNNPVNMPGLSPQEGSDLLGARLVGRWESGAPIDLRPFEDDPTLAADAQKNNNFAYAAELSTQKICPFAAHTRKTNPRDDLGFPAVEPHRILRRGIQFGPELTPDEIKQNKTIENRGLLFHSYQSAISQGFRFIQIFWANNPTFPFTETTPDQPGLDAIIGQGPTRATVGLSGTDPDTPSKTLKLPAEWVIPRGGEYFFSPSIKGLQGTISLA